MFAGSEDGKTARLLLSLSCKMQECSHVSPKATDTRPFRGFSKLNALWKRAAWVMTACWTDLAQMQLLDRCAMASLNGVKAPSSQEGAARPMHTVQVACNILMRHTGADRIMWKCKILDEAKTPHHLRFAEPTEMPASQSVLLPSPAASLPALCTHWGAHEIPFKQGSRR